MEVSKYPKGYALCRRPPLSREGLCGGGYVVPAQLPCLFFWLLVVLSFLVFLGNAEAEWLLEVSFMVFLLTAVTLDMDIVFFGCPKPIIWQARCFHFSTRGAILAAWGHPG